MHFNTCDQFIYLSNHHYNHFHHPKKFSCVHCSWSPSLSLALGNLTCSLSLCIGYVFSRVLYRWNHKCVLICIWLLLLSMFLRFVHIVTCYQYFIPLYYQIIFQCMGMPHLYIHSSIGEYLGGFYCLAVTNNDIVSIYVHVFYWHA